MLDTHHRPWPHRLDASGRTAVAALVDGSDRADPATRSGQQQEPSMKPVLVQPGDRRLPARK